MHYPERPHQVWPERLMHHIRKFNMHPLKIVHVDERTKKVRHEETIIPADVMWPSYEAVNERIGHDNELRRLQDIQLSPYGKAIIKLYSLFIDADKQQGKKADDLTSAIDIQLALDELHNIWHVVRWVRAGMQTYILDEATTLALMHTDISDVPVSELKLPFDSFYLKVPPSLDWRVTLTDNLLTPGGDAEGQPFDGWLVTGEYRGDDLDLMRVVVCGKSEDPNTGDNNHWFHNKMAAAIREGWTIGKFLSGPEYWKVDDGAISVAPDTFVQPEPLKLLFGAMLYITSAHPTLRALPPLEAPRGMASTPRHAAKHRTYRESSKSHIIWVGGADDAIQTERQRDLPTGSHAPPRPHLRSGHFRTQWYGPRTAREHQRIWIKPTQVGDWDRKLAWARLQGTQIGKTLRPTRPVELKEEHVPEFT